MTFGQMNYDHKAIADPEIPQASAQVFQHLLKTYASEANKLNSVWLEFAPDDLSFKPHARSSSVREIIEHELLSERRFFAEFLGLPEPPAAEVMPRGSHPCKLCGAYDRTVARAAHVSCRAN